MYDRGIKIRQLQCFAGHSTPEQTMDYIRRKNDVEIDEWLIDDRDLPNSETEETASTPIIPFCAVGDNGDRFKNKKQAEKPYFKGLPCHPETVDRGIEHEMILG